MSNIISNIKSAGSDFMRVIKQDEAYDNIPSEYDPNSVSYWDHFDFWSLTSSYL